MHEKADELLDLLAPDLAQLLLDEDREAFVSRVLARFPNDDPGMMRALAGALYRAMPLPGRGFRQESQVKVGRNEACPCGSGRKYKQCCGEYPEPPLPPADGLLQLVLPHMNRDQWVHFSQHSDIPADFCADLAWHCMHIDKPKKAWEVIKPLSERLDTLGDEHQHAIAYGLDALQALGHDRKRERLMEALCEHPHSRSLRSIGHQRLAMVTMQRDQVTKAKEHLEQARRHDSDQIELHIAELSVLPYLVSEAELRERARFWQKRLQKRFGRQYPYQEMVDDIAERGRAAVEALTGMPVRSIDEVEAEAGPQFESSLPLGDSGVLAAGTGAPGLVDALAELGLTTEVLLAQQVADALHQAMGQTSTRLIPDKTDRERSVIAYDKQFIRLEHQWLEAWYGCAVPASGPLPAPEDDYYASLWFDPMPEWADMLQASPELMGSFQVLGELKHFLSNAPDALFDTADFDIDTTLLVPFSAHRLACLQSLLNEWDGKRPLVDKPALNNGLLDCVHETLSELWSHGFRLAAPRLSEKLLHLLPEDPTGMRFELSGHYALVSNLEGIEWLFQRYGEDTRYPDVAFARLVQLWQQDDTQRVLEHLKLLKRRFPDDLKMLRKGRLDDAPLGAEVWEMNDELCQFLK